MMFLSFEFFLQTVPEPAAATSTTNGGLVNGGTADFKPASDMTSKDYYFDSYAHFGIHEVKINYLCSWQTD